MGMLHEYDTFWNNIEELSDALIMQPCGHIVVIIYLFSQTPHI